MSECFNLPESARASIKASLKPEQFSTESVDGFITSIVADVACWRQDWPEISPADLRTLKRRLANIEKHLGLLLFEMRSVPRGSWPPKVPHNTADLEGFLIAVQEERARKSSGYNNLRKINLASRIALSYCHCFKERPRRSPNSPFMECVTLVGQAAGVTIGKDLAADGLDEGVEAYNRHLRLFGLGDI